MDAHASFREHVACLFEKDGWVFSLIYTVTFGGFMFVYAYAAQVAGRSPLGQRFKVDTKYATSVAIASLTVRPANG